MIKKIEKKDELMSKLIVQKSKPLFGLWVSHLTLIGAKLLDVYLAKINSHDETTRMVTFKKSELEEILGMKRIKAEDLKPALNRLMDKYAIAEILNGRKHYILVNLFDIAHMEFDENGVTMVRMHCSEPAKKYFFNIEEYQYVSYALKKVVPLKSMYTYNMFLILQLYRWKKSFKLTLKKLREYLGCVKSKEIDPKNQDKDVFLEFKRFNDKVLKVAQKELAERVNYKFTYEAVKTGKNVVSVIFYLNLDSPEIKSTAREIKEVLKERVNKPYESVDNPNETTTTTQPKYNGFKEKGLYPYSNKHYTPIKKPGLPSFEYKQWDQDVIQKIIDKSGADDEDDEDISNKDSNSKKDIDSNNEYKKFNLDDLRKIIEGTGDDEDEDISNKDSNSNNLYDIDIDNLSDDEIIALFHDESRVNRLSDYNFCKFFSRYKQLKEKRKQKEFLNHG